VQSYKPNNPNIPHDLWCGIELYYEPETENAYVYITQDLYGEQTYGDYKAINEYIDVRNVLSGKIREKEIRDALNREMERVSATYELLSTKEKELEVTILACELDEEKHMHVLAERNTNRSFIVWTALRSGYEKEFYQQLYNGRYDMNREEALDELALRSGKREVELELEYVGEDDWLRKVYQDKDGHYYKSYEKEIEQTFAEDLYTALDFYGEPSVPLRKKCEYFNHGTSKRNGTKP